MNLVGLAGEEPKIFWVDRLNQPKVKKRIRVEELEDNQYDLRLFVEVGRQKSFVDYKGHTKENIAGILERESYIKVYVCEFRGGKK